MAPLDGKCDPVRPEMNQPNIQTDLDRAKHATTIPKSEADIIATGNNRSSRTPEYGPPSTHAYPREHRQYDHREQRQQAP